MNLGILCSGNLGCSTLIKLESEYGISFVFTDANSDCVIEFCNQKDIPLFIGNPRNGRAKGFFRYQCDYLVSINYLFIVEKDVINLAIKLAFNVHGSLLPKYRGRTPHVWAIINNEVKAGITAHVIDEGCDTGDILQQKVVEIKSGDTGNDILKQYEKLYFPLIKDVLEKSRDNVLTRVEQDESKATYFKKRIPEDGKISWEWSKERIKNWVRAQADPYPGAFSFIDGKTIVIDRVDYSSLGFNQADCNGLIIQDTPNIIVKTPNGCLELLDIRENKKLCKMGRIFRNE